MIELIICLLATVLWVVKSFRIAEGVRPSLKCTDSSGESANCQPPAIIIRNVTAIERKLAIEMLSSRGFVVEYVLSTPLRDCAEATVGQEYSFKLKLSPVLIARMAAAVGLPMQNISFYTEKEMLMIYEQAGTLLNYAGLNFESSYVIRGSQVVDGITVESDSKDMAVAYGAEYGLLFECCTSVRQSLFAPALIAFVLVVIQLLPPFKTSNESNRLKSVFAMGLCIWMIIAVKSEKQKCAALVSVVNNNAVALFANASRKLRIDVTNVKEMALAVASVAGIVAVAAAYVTIQVC
jgi:hypothetical protein